MADRPALRIGLTGGIGSGKSTVARMLSELGAWVVDTDAIARSLTAPGGAALPAIAARFGDTMVDSSGALDRGRMRELAFGDRQALRNLEAILHPLILQQAQAQAALAAPGQTVVFDVPLLVESGHWASRVDQVMVVDCREQTQVQRVMARSGWPEPQVRQVMAKQAPRAVRCAAANVILDNDDVSLETLRQAVEKLWQQWHPASSTN